MTAITFANRSHLPYDYMDEIGELVKDRKEPLWVAIDAFTYSVMIGKHMERARRKRSKQ